MDHLIISYSAKQAGKTTSCTAFYGYYLTQLGVIPNANIDPNGKMSVVYNRNTNEGIYFDIDDDSPEMVEFKRRNVWQHIKHSSFADALKNSIVSLFSIDKKLIYGTDEDKNTLTHIRWADAFKLMSPERVAKIQSHHRTFEGLGLKPPEFLTIRELCQVFGTDICRTLDLKCHLRSAVSTLLTDNPTVGYIPDGRFENEFEYFDSEEAKKLLGKTKVWRIKYTRNSSVDNPPGEQGLPEIDNSRYDLVINNSNGMSVLEKNAIFIDFFIKQGVLSSGSIETGSC